MIHRSRPLLLLATLGWLAAFPAIGSATAPGANGRVAVASWTSPKSKKSSPSSAITSVLPDGAAAQTVFAKKKVIVGNPEYSADGSKIAFVVGAYGAERKTDGIYVAAADGSGARQVARSSWADGVAWSPDGAALVYADVMDGIYRVPAEGGKAKLIVQVLDDGGFFRRPTFTADGTSILFERDTLSSNTDGKLPWLEVVELWKAAADGSGAGPLFPNASMPFAGEPDVSPDGKSLVFAGPRDKYGKRYVLYTAPLDGSAAPRALHTTAKGVWIDGPTWSPDGTRIAFTTGTESKGSTVLVMDPATAATTVLRRSAKAQFTGPTWQPLPAG